MDYNNPQTPSGEPPDHRFEELAKQNKMLMQQVQQLKGIIDTKFQPEKPQENQPFTPEVQQALDTYFQKKLQQETQQFQNQLGMVYGQLDEAKFMQKYGGDDKYTKMIPKVKQLIQEKQQEGQWISHEDALKWVYFEETGRKAQEAPQKPKPVFSPVYNTWVDPLTGMPVAPEPEVQQTQPPAPQEAAQQVDEFGQPQTPQAPVQPPQQMQQVQQTPSQFQMPSQGMNTPQQTGSSPGVSLGKIELEASDADLEAFEKKFGDISF